MYRIVTADGFVPSDVGAQLVERLGPQARVEILDTGINDISPLLMVLRLVALVLLLMAGTNLLSTLMTSTREASGRIGVQLAMGFTPRQIVTQGAVAGAFVGLIATIVGLPLGLWIFRVLSNAVSRAIGVGPGWVPWPSVASMAILAVGAIVVAGGLGALAAARTAARPAADLVRGE
jgi:putative ABC transport system permease protein